MTVQEAWLQLFMAFGGYFMNALLCHMYTEIFVKKRQFKKAKSKRVLLAVQTFALYTNLLFFRNHMPVKVLMMVGINFFFMWLCFEHEALKIGFCVLLHFGMAVVIDYTWPITLSIFIPSITRNVMYDSAGGMTLSFFANFVHLAIILFIKKCVLQRYSSGLSRGEWMYFSVFPLITLAVFWMINRIFGFVENSVQKKIVTGLAIGLVTMNVAIFFLIKNILKRESKINESNLVLERVKNETKMYRNISENYALQRKREHEYKNQMAIITALARENKIEELNTYLKSYQKSISIKVNAIDTNHVIVNAILNSKYQEAKEKNIVFAVKVNDLSKIKLKDEDIVLILSNLLNNAMEACEHCKKPVIRLKFLNEPEYVLISVANTLSKKPLMVDNTYITTKTEQKEAHGIGIENIKEAVTHYGGECVIRHDEAFFYFTIYVPIG